MVNAQRGSTAAQRLANRRFNEHLKLLASLFNALSIGMFGAAVIVPVVTIPASFFSARTIAWIVVAGVLHLIGQSALSFLRSED